MSVSHSCINRTVKTSSVRSCKSFPKSPMNREYSLNEFMFKKTLFFNTSVHLAVKKNIKTKIVYAIAMNDTRSIQFFFISALDH